ncbi:DEAD/DEAH box helicase [candidate division KSB1 bacterium]|nr:DEAD/DEAH box helicase [candidate division KSB1 bacterium]
MKNLQSFADLGLSSRILEIIHRKGFEAPSPIQEKVIPLVLQSNMDIIGQAQTGTGKTAAFGLPIMDILQDNSKSVNVLVLTPTRELCIQVAEELHSLKGKKKFKILPVYGGQSMELQLRHLKQGVDIVVGTPGRILDHLNRKSLKVDRLDFCVLDEADEMLNMGFLEDIEKILDFTNSDKRTLLFSATMPKEIVKVASKYMHRYEHVRVQNEEMTVPQTDQIYFQVSEENKFEALCRIMDIEDGFYGIVFCRTRLDADRIAHRLLDRGYDADSLHGELVQSQREKVMGRFKNKLINVLVATDVAARGLDVSDLTHVINYALPQDPDAYIHRIGRTGRAGKEGTAVTFITPEEENKLEFIGRKTKSTIRREKLPKIRDIIRAKKKRIHTDVQELIESELAHDLLPMAEKLLAENQPEQVLAALLKLAFAEELDRGSYNEIRDVQPVISGKTRLFIARGQKDKMTPKKIIHFIRDRVKIQPDKIQDILIQPEFSFITVPFREAELILKQFNTGKSGRKSLVEKARPK